MDNEASTNRPVTREEIRISNEVDQSDQIRLTLNGERVSIDRDVFELLFEDSVVADRADVRRAKEGVPISYQTFIELARTAEIPYPLFFAPRLAVEAQLAQKTKKLMAGFTTPEFSIHSRSRIRLSDFELIVKDLRRKQALLKKYDHTLVDNEVVGILRRSKSAVEAATIWRSTLGLDESVLPNARNKDILLSLLIGKLESRQILVSQSARNHMPQQMPKRAQFSGLTIKDRKVPYIFVASGDEGDHLEPTGRRIFTLTLLSVLIARGIFAPVTFKGHSSAESSPFEYEIAAEILMPSQLFTDTTPEDVDAIKAIAERFHVTPSAATMRARRLNLISRAEFERYMSILREEYLLRDKPRLSSPLAVNALRKYNGRECSRRMLAILDAGAISTNEFRRVVFLNKAPSGEIERFRAALG